MALEPFFQNMMKVTVRLHAPAGTASAYGDDPVASTYTAVPAYVREHQRVDYDSETEQAVGSGTCWLSQIVSGLNDRWTIEIPDLATGTGWRQCAVQDVDTAYDEFGQPYYQAVKYAERRKGARAGGTVF